jgi:epoxyqueuosine reductase
MLISPRRGSYFFLATVLTSLDLAVDSPFEPDRCGTCRRCLDACPTAALPTPRTLDSRRCISYLTIEHRDEIDETLQPLIGQWLFGCDVCQNVCPWNIRFSETADDPVLGLDQSHEFLGIRELLELTDQEFADRWGWTAMQRPGVRGIQRNARIVSRNVGRPSAESRPPHTSGHQNSGNPVD